MRSTEKDIITRACELIFENEGGYTSVNPDDNGALSAGRLQWHGTRALKLIKKIVSAMRDKACLEYVTESLLSEIKSAKSWSSRCLGAYEKEQLSNLLGTDESIRLQNEQAETDVASYIEHIRALGVTDEDAVIFMADIENQGGASASRRIIRAAEGTDIDSLYRSCECDRVFCDRMKRRARVYMKLTGRVPGEGGDGILLYEVRAGDTLSRIAREYKVSVGDICRKNSIKNPDRISVGDILRIPLADEQKEDEQKECALDSYTVKKGDTLSGIGAALSLDWREMARINGIEPPYLIYPGQVLRLCEADSDGVRTHKVVRGDTLFAISRLWGVSISSIVRENKEKYKNISPSYIVAGWELIIPQEAENDT